MAIVHDKPEEQKESNPVETPAEKKEEKTEAKQEETVSAPAEASETKEEVATPNLTDESADIPSVDPLSDFKEKMNREETSVPDNNTPKKSYMWPILFIFIIAVALMAGIFAYKQGLFRVEKAVVVTPTPVPTVTPEPAVVDLTKYEIEVQNGSEVDGEAGRQKANLEGEGFTVASIGNADNSDYTDTIIKAKADVDEGFIAKLKSVLESSFTVGETETLPDDSSIPVIVILGTKI